MIPFHQFQWARPASVQRLQGSQSVTGREPIANETDAVGEAPRKDGTMADRFIAGHEDSPAQGRFLRDYAADCSLLNGFAPRLRHVWSWCFRKCAGGERDLYRGRDRVH